MKTLYPILAFAWLLVFTGCVNELSIDVKQYGLVAGSEAPEVVSKNTIALQSAIDDCSKAGGGMVVVSEGDYTIGTILLKNGVTLHIEKGSSLIASRNPYDYQNIDPFVDATGQTRGRCLIGAVDAEHIGITGGGTIDGRGDWFTKAKVRTTLAEFGLEEETEIEVKSDLPYVNKNIRSFDRPFLVRLVRSENIFMRDIELRQPAAWTLHLYQCQTFDIAGIRIYSHANHNNDGIDIDSSSFGSIEDCDINSGDDAICFKSTSPIPTTDVTVRNCKLKSNWGTIKFGTESMGDFERIEISDCYIYDTRGGGIKILSVDGANIRDIVIRNITMENVDMPLFVRLGERRLVYRDAEQQPVGSIDGLLIDGITAVTRNLENSRVTPPTGVFITGTPHHPIGNLVLKNIHVTLPGGGKAVHRSIVPPENETMYPEFTKFNGPLPAYGMFARHVIGLDYENLKFDITAPDARDEVIIQK